MLDSRLLRILMLEFRSVFQRLHFSRCSRSETIHEIKELLDMEVSSEEREAAGVYLVVQMILVTADEGVKLFSPNFGPDGAVQYSGFDPGETTFNGL